MKSDVAKFFATCLTCQKSKVEHQRPGGMLLCELRWLYYVHKQEHMQVLDLKD